VTQAHARIPIARPLLGEEEKQAVLAVLESGQLAQGPLVAELEARFAAWCGARHAVAVCSGTAALHLALLALGVGPGDEVITSPFSFVASANAALLVGARPVFVDVEPRTFCLDADLVEASLSPRTRAILAVHLYGHPAPMPELRDIARRHGLLLIEDACQAHGAEIDGRKVGTLGDVAAFSLYATKNITAGEGGLVLTDDDRVAERVRALRNHGASERYRHELLGYNFRLSDLHAAIALAQLRKLDAFNAARRDNAARLTRLLCGLSGLVVPVERAGYRHVYHQYTVRILGGRDDVRSELMAREIETGVHYPIPLHRQPLYDTLGYGTLHLPVAEHLAEEVLSLPVHPSLGPSDLDYMGEVLWDVLRAR
jgi:dTDP-4-amino-4,6-dideoxygalactose transaminase